MPTPAFTHHCWGRAMTDLAHAAPIASQNHVIRYALDQAPRLFLATATVSQDGEGPGSITAATATHFNTFSFVLLQPFNCQHIMQRSKPGAGRLGLHTTQWKGSSDGSHPAQRLCPALSHKHTQARGCACVPA